MLTRQELADKYIVLERKHTQLKSEAAAVWHELEEVEAELLLAMEGEGLQNFKTAEGITMSILSDVSVKKLDEDTLFNWLESSGNGDGIKRTIHAGTLKSIVKTEIETNGLAEIPGAEIKFFNKIGVRGLNKKNGASSEA